MTTTKTADQAWAEIRDTMADTILNMKQKEAFVRSVLSGILANPPAAGHSIAPAPLTWTSEKPKVAGWYWMQPKGGAGCIVDVDRYNDTLAIDRGWGYDPIADDMEWAGPIPEPTPSNIAAKGQGVTE